MSYTALYRKFRPQTFSEVKGQDHIVKALANQIKMQKPAHAYLFCGTRGTGKTSIAKILARAVNCENPVEGSCCNECAMCKKISSGASMNVIEIDAASNNGVDNIRQLIDEIAYPPAEGKYKVYIIDEVHMLSIGAFNALLKTLEEPPSYVIFILATTEAHKVPVTIMSRCQRYDFHRISSTDISEHLQNIADQEGLAYEKKAIKYIAKLADGAMRDALSLLDKCMAFGTVEKLSYEKVLEVLGTVDISTYYELTKSIHEGNVNASLTIIDDLINIGKELTQFIPDYIWYLRNLLLLGISSETKDSLDISQEAISEMEKQAESIDSVFLIHCINRLSELMAVLRSNTSKRVMTEVYIIRLCCPQTDIDTESLADRIRQLEDKLKNVQYFSGNSQIPSLKKEEQIDKNSMTSIEAEINNTSQESVVKTTPILQKTETLTDSDINTYEGNKTVYSEDWNTILRDKKKLYSGFTPFEIGLLNNSVLSVEDDNILTVYYSQQDPFLKSCFETAHLDERLKKNIKKIFNKDIVCRIAASASLDLVRNNNAKYNSGDNASPKEKEQKTDNKNSIEKLRSVINIPIEQE